MQEPNLGQVLTLIATLPDEQLLQALRGQLKTEVPSPVQTRLSNVLETFALGIEARKFGQDFLKKQLESTGATGHRFKDGLQETIRKIGNGFALATCMYVGIYILGFALIITAVVASFLSLQVPAIISGVLGSAGLLSFFFAHPPQLMQRSRANLAQLQAAFFTWFADIQNWNSYLGTLSASGRLNFDEVSKVSQAATKSTEEILQMISTNCDFGLDLKTRPSSLHR